MKECTYDFVAAKEEYRAFCESGKHDIQIFAQPWYLDAVCDSPDDWQVIVYKKGTEIVASFPFQYLRGAHGLWRIQNPWMTPRLGIWINYDKMTSKIKRDTLENQATEFIIQALPNYDYFSAFFDARYTNWRNFYNHGFSQETRYSYVVTSALFDNEYLKSLSKHRRKAIELQQDSFHVEKIYDFDDYWNFFSASYRNRMRIPSYTREKMERLFCAAQRKNAATVYAAKNAHNQITAIHLTLMDNRRTYAMFGSYDPMQKPSGRELLTYTAITEALNSGLAYDFEGSMIPGVAQYNSEFNAELEPYFLITNYSPRMKFRMNAKENLSILKNRIFGREKQRED